MADPGRIFADRREAGRALAQRVRVSPEDDPVVLALPRGGVPVAVEVAAALHAPLDVLAVRKLGAPGQPELAVGAVAEGRIGVLDQRAAALTGLTQELLDATLDAEERELRRRVRAYRGGRPATSIEGRTAILVDDGLATGLSDLAAVRSARAQGATRVIVAAPVSSAEAVPLLGEDADEVITVTIPEGMGSVGRWYGDFAPVPDAEVVRLLATTRTAPPVRRSVTFPAGDGRIDGDLVVPEQAHGLVLFAHGSGSSRLSPRNREVAHALQTRGLATLLFDLLTPAEAAHRELVFDIPLLGDRLEAVARWTREEPTLRDLPLGLFGASTGAAAAVRAAAALDAAVAAVVSRGGRPDLAPERLPLVTAPTLLVVGGADPQVLALNREAAAALRCPHEVTVIPGASHVFEEPGTLAEVARLAGDWFEAHLVAGTED